MKFMNKNLLALLFSCLALVSLHAQTPYWSDPLNYPVGNITTNSSGLWINHSGNQSDSLVVNYAGSSAAAAGNRYEINEKRTDDVHRWFDSVATNGVGPG